MRLQFLCVHHVKIEQWDIHDNHTDLISLIHRLMCDMKNTIILFLLDQGDDDDAERFISEKSWSLIKFDFLSLLIINIF